MTIIILGAAEIRRTRKSEAFHTEEKGDEEYDIDRPLTGPEIGQQLKAIFTNPAFLLLCLTSCGDNIIISGFTAFGPKYVELQYNLESGPAGALFGKIYIYR